MDIQVEKLTGVNLLREANRFTTNSGSVMQLATAYKYGHSPIRTQLFWVELYGIPLFVASQLVRSHVGVQFFQLSRRVDRGGSDFKQKCKDLANNLTEDTIDETKESIMNLPKEFDRYAPTNLAFIINAEALMNMAHKRLCNKASLETTLVMHAILLEINKIDPALGKHLVPQCIFRGGICPEPNSCKWISSEEGQKALQEYKMLYASKMIKPILKK